MAQMGPGPAPITIADETSMINGSRVSREFFDVLGVRPIIGRTFTEDELRVGGPPALIISDRLWRTRMAALPIDTLRIRANNEIFPVIGIMPPGFDYPAGAEYWFADERSPRRTSRTSHNTMAVARLAEGVALETAIGELSTLSRNLKQQYGDGTWMSDATAIPLREQLTVTTRPALLLLFTASIVLLLIACLNVSNLQLARASTRRRELAVRVAVGAGGGRIARQLLAEAAVLALAATLVGLAVALGGVRLLLALQPANLPRIENVALDVAALLFAIAVATVTAVGLGLAAAVRTSKPDIKEALSEGSRSLASGRTSERVRQMLVVAQVALTIVLLIGAGLLARSFATMMAVDLGYRTDHALLIDSQFMVSRESFDPAVYERRKLAQRDMLSRLRALAGVRHAGLITAHPLGVGGFNNGQFIEMTRIDEIRSPEDRDKLGPEIKARLGFAGFRVASEGYFQAMGIRLLRGRQFEDSDGPDAPHVALISESLAATKWPNQDPIGRFIQFGNMDGDLRGFRVVGVVSDVREVSPETVPGPLFYGYYRQRMASRFTLVIQTDQASTLASSARRIVREADPELPVQMRTLEEAFDRAVAGRRFSLTLIGTFSAAALILATLGVYGLISYLVAERTREIGIRLALGAESIDVLRIILGRGLALACAGIAVGVVAAFGLKRLLDGMLFGVSPTDPIALSTVMMLTLAAVAAASYLPARRALRVAPTIAMRAE
jgi:predicted permease